MEILLFRLRLGDLSIRAQGPFLVKKFAGRVSPRMATALRSSFVGGVSLSSLSKAAEPRRTGNRLSLRVVSERSSAAMPGSEGNLMRPDGGEVSRLLGTGIEKQGELWWAPLFDVSADEQWANLLTKEAAEKGAQQEGMIASRRLAPASTTAIALPVLGASQPNGSKPNSSRGAFTAEKARALRKSMRGSQTWHDGWYHSAIASRLAEQID